MKFFYLLLLLFSSHALANFTLEITPLNSPVSEAHAKFKIIAPKDFTAKEVRISLTSKDYRFKEWIRDFPLKHVSDSEYLLLIPLGVLPRNKFDLHATIEAHEPTNNILTNLINKLLGRAKIAKGKSKFEVSKQIIVHGDPQPPHPGEAGEATLLGIDSDNDGVRDDVEIWINEKLVDYPAKVIKAMKDMAKADQLVLDTVDNKEKNIWQIHRLLDRSSCIDFTIGAEPAHKIDKEYRLIYLNTKKRVLADIKANQNFHGQTVRDKPIEQYCLP